jgi:hypothetical protein
MATTGTNNNTKAVLRRVNSSSSTQNINFVKVDQGENPESNKLYSEFMLSGSSVYSNNNFNDEKQTKIDVRLGGIRPRVPEGGKIGYNTIKVVPDYNTTATAVAGATGILDIYGRVVKVSGGNLVPQTGSKGGYAFDTTSVTLTADVSPGNRSYNANLGLKYYTKMTTSAKPKTLEVFADEGDQIVSG